MFVKSIDKYVFWVLNIDKWNKVEQSGKSERGYENMFIGEYEHSLDAKNRIMIPSKFRSKLGERFILTKGLDHCLFIYTMEE